MLDAIRAWWHHGTDSIYTPDIAHYPTSLRSLLIMQQNATGWRQLIQWQIRRARMECNSRSVSLPNERRPKQPLGKTYRRPVANQGDTSDLGKMARTMEAAERKPHGKDTIARTEAISKEVSRRLEEIYDLRGHMEPSAQELLCTDRHRSTFIETDLDDYQLVTNSCSIVSGEPQVS